MSGCCHDCVDPRTAARQRGVLRVTLLLNAIGFAAILAGAWLARSSALFSDSFDYLGDVAAYALSLWASGSAVHKIAAARFKGVLMLAAGFGVLGQLGWRLAHPALPHFDWMIGFTVIGLLINGTCLWLLTRHRDDDLNMASVWLCARNDIAANLSVLLAAAGVWLSGSAWPDRIVALGLSILLLHSGMRVLRRAGAAAARDEPAAADFRARMVR
jgi:Co/Zn/Cd efflux system component